MTKPFEPTKPVQTRDGRKARILCKDLNSDVYTIVAATMENNGTESVRLYTNTGQILVGKPNHDLDLVNIPKRTSRWTNVYPTGDHGSKERADILKNHNRIGVIEIIFEDGKPVDSKWHKDGGSNG